MTDPKQHTYRVQVAWTGNQGSGTTSYRGYSRAHRITAGAKPAIDGSSDPAFRGDPSRWNPEELLLASLSACHKLWYLHLCAEAGVTVLSYEDDAEATMLEEPSGAGQFTAATLRPRIVLAPGSDPDRARSLHDTAHAMCFVARSVKFPVTHHPAITLAP